MLTRKKKEKNGIFSFEVAQGTHAACVVTNNIQHMGPPANFSSPKQIKALDVSNMDIILRGKQWDSLEDPCAKSVVHLLERNESLVTWLQPKVC